MQDDDNDDDYDDRPRYFAWIRYLLHDISKFNLEVLVVNINNTVYCPKNMLTNYLIANMAFVTRHEVSKLPQ